MKSTIIFSILLLAACQQPPMVSTCYDANDKKYTLISGSGDTLPELYDSDGYQVQHKVKDLRCKRLNPIR